MCFYYIKSYHISQILIFLLINFNIRILDNLEVCHKDFQAVFKLIQ